jgi:hypothetical protein
MVVLLDRVSKFEKFLFLFLENVICNPRAGPSLAVVEVNATGAGSGS